MVVQERLELEPPNQAVQAVLEF